MTGIVVCRLNDEGGVIVVSDGAYFESSDNFTVTGFKDKLLMLPHLGAVLTGRGAGDFVPLLYHNQKHACGTHWESFDEIIDTLTAAVKWNLEHIARCYPGRLISSEVIPCGWSERNSKFESWSLPVEKGEMKGSVELGSFYAAPFPSKNALAANGFEGEQINFDGSDDAFTSFMQAMRETPQQMGDNPSITGSVIGGFVQHTLLTRNEIVTRIIHRWPDKVDERIDPKRAGARTKKPGPEVTGAGRAN